MIELKILKDKKRYEKIPTISNKKKNQYFYNKYSIFYFLFTKQNSLISIKYFYLNSLTFLLFFISLGLYKNSLKGCDGPQTVCLNVNGIIFYYNRVYEGIECSIIMSIIFFFSLFGFSHRIFCIIELITYIILFYFNRGYDLLYHGSYNTIIISTLFIISFIIIIIIYYIIYFFIRKKYLISFLILFTWIIPIIIVKIVGKKYCHNWERGLNNEKIINSEKYDACYIEKPKYCFIPLFDNVFDLSKFMYGCKNYGNDQKLFFKYFSGKKDVSEYKYPLTTDFNFYENSKVGRYHKEILNNINNKKKFNESEVSVIYDEKGKGSVKIKILKNETLSNERKDLELLNPVKFENIYVIYIDSVSRNHFYRKLKKTSKFLESILGTNLNKIDNNLNSYQFFKYQNFEGITQLNVIPMFYGNSMNSEQGTSITRLLKQKGFITCGAHNLCHREIFLLQNFKNSKINFESFDHEHFALFCDPNYCEPNNPYEFFKGTFSIFRRCLYEKDTFEYVFEYVLKFLEAYKTNRKFFRVHFIDAHEGSMEVIKYLDEPLLNFIQTILKNYFNEKTGIFITSDHGENMISIHDMLLSQDFKYEKTLGVLFLILPNNDIYNQTAIEINSQRLVTPYDIHDTIIDMGNIDDSYLSPKNKGQSLFIEIDGLKRTCNLYDDDFRDMKKYCRCINYK